ncbi:MAG: hypothetical protein GY811_08250 [Myxococcales bacterium]|nr:hypothetical protein [Myxococcales bacterium]
MTVIRAVQFASVVVTAWSSAKPWGDELGIGKGPPGHLERQLVGAALLLLLGSLAMIFTAHKGTKPGRVALAVAGISSLGAVGLALSVRSTALSSDQANVLLGGGWMWMAAGACMSLGATASALALSKSEAAEEPAPNRPKKKKKQGN